MPVPITADNGNSNVIDWRNRSLLSPDEPIFVWGRDRHGIPRHWRATWGDIEGDIAHAQYGPLQIESVQRVVDMVYDDDPEPQRLRSLRTSPERNRPSEITANDHYRWNLELRAAQNERWFEHGIFEFADELGVTPEAVYDLNAGTDLVAAEWVFPERDSHGAYVGLATRLFFPYTDENTGKTVTKRFRSGGTRGLYYSEEGWHQFDGPIVMPEGFSDTAACLSMELNVLGRPSATIGNRSLFSMLSDVETTEPLIVVADRDFDEEMGKSPGFDGACKAARFLATHFQRPIHVAFPPGEFKDTRDWFRDFCQGDLSSERLDEARKQYIQYLTTHARVIHPGTTYHLDDDSREIVTLDQWRQQMQQARFDSVSQPGHYADFSPTGAGKSHADRALVRTALHDRKSVLLVVPTHANCREEVQQLAEAGIAAVTYPELSRETCQRYGDAHSAVSRGLNLMRSVCTSCPHFRDESCAYRQQIENANNAPVAVCTTARLGKDRAVASGRDVISVHEAADSAICEQVSLKRAQIERARRVLRIMSNMVRDPEAYTGRAQRRTVETRSYLRHLAHLCSVLLQAIDQGVRPEGEHLIDAPPGYWMRFSRQWLEEHELPEEFLRACEEAGWEGMDERIDSPTLRGLGLIAQGEPWDVLSWSVDSPQRGLHQEARVIAQRRLTFDDDQVWWWQDATGGLDQLQQLLGQPVLDCTPDGRIERAQRVEIVPVDITRKTAVQTVANAIRMEVIRGSQRLGVIGHKVHVDELQADDCELLGPEIRSRVHMMSHYGAGVDRASNQWLECDRLLVLGTPRIGDEAIREELWRCGEQEAARVAEPGWGKYLWQGRRAGHEHVVGWVAGSNYSDPRWHQACLRVTRAAMQQALGRARTILEHGIPAAIWTTESLGEFPVRTEPQPTTAVIDVVEVLWLAELNPEGQPHRRGIRVEDGRVWLTGAEIARRLDRHRGVVSRLLEGAEMYRFVERAARRHGWALRLDFGADERPRGCEGT